MHDINCYNSVTVFTRKETALVAESEMTPYSYELHKLDVFTQ